MIKRTEGASDTGGIAKSNWPGIQFPIVQKLLLRQRSRRARERLANHVNIGFQGAIEQGPRRCTLLCDGEARVYLNITFEQGLRGKPG